jgi:hypothetical protein
VVVRRLLGSTGLDRPAAVGHKREVDHVKVLLAVLLAASTPSAADAKPAAGVACTVKNYGHTKGSLVCGKTSATTYVWAQVPPQILAATPTVKKPTVNSIPPGQWLVGPEVKPGTYRTPTAECWWERLKGFQGSNDVTDAQFTSVSGGIVTIRAFDKGFKSDCRWTKIEV